MRLDWLNKGMNKKIIVKHYLFFALFGTAMCVGGCGGGKSSPAQAFVPPVTSNGGLPTWKAGEFQDESLFKDVCAAPRTGIDPQTNSPYRDKKGTITHENFWLRSWSNRTYLWYNEITDRNPSGFSDRLAYFDVLRTTRTTASGNPVDKFHFSRSTEEYQQSVSSGASVGYGVRFRLIRSAPPREILVAYTEPNSPAENAGLKRGDRILEIDGENAVNGANVNVLNRGLFPETEGERHEFVVQGAGGATTTVTMDSGVVTSAPVRVSKVIERPSGAKVAYVLFNSFGSSISEKALYDAFTSLQNQNVSDLVLDLRYNGGGFLDISSELGYMIAGQAATNGRIYETLVFNDKHRTTNPVTGATITPTPFHSTGQGFSVANGTPLPSLKLPRVFVLSTASTCSASESLVNSLRGINVEVVLIGTTTCGKPYGFYGTDNCGETYFTIQFRGENDKKFGDYSDGFSPYQGGVTVGEPVPGCSIDDDFSKPLGDETEGLLSAALSYAESGSCPGVTTAKTDKVWGEKQSGDEPLSLLNDPYLKSRLLFESSRILNNPNAPSE